MFRLRLASAPSPSTRPVEPPVAPFVLDGARLASLGFTRESFAEEMARRAWFHVFDFGDGLATAGRDVTATKQGALELPDLTGRSVLDIGAYDGFFSFDCERLGAARVVASDHWSWTWPGEDARRNFDLIRSVLGSRVEPLEVPVEALNPAEHGTFDVTLFLGVLYHAPDMLGYLRAVRSVTHGMLVLETLVDALDIDDRPVAVFYPRGAIPGDDSNHWGPNPACVEEMLSRVGFSRVERKSLWDRDSLEATGARPPSGRLTNGRMVFHAWV